MYIATDYPDQGQIQIVELDDYVQRVVEGFDISLNCPSAPTWTFILCNAVHDPQGPMNHWVPAFTEEELGEEAYKKAVERADAIAEEREVRLKELVEFKRKKHQRLADLDVFSEESEEWQISVELLASAESDLIHERRWQQFRQRCKERQLHPVKVPADGNCLLWSYIVLRDDQDLLGSCLNGEEFEGRLHVAKAMRTGLTLGWRGVRSDAKWQRLFQILYHQDPVAIAAVKTETKVEQPSTPRKEIPRHEKISIDLCTPDSKAERPEALKRVNACRKAPGFQVRKDRCFQPTQPIKKETKSAKQAKQEPLPEKPSSAKLSAPPPVTSSGAPPEEPPVPPPADPPKPEDDDVSVMSGPEDRDMPKGEEIKRRRIGRKKPKCERDLHMKGLRIYLARAGVAYNEWLSWHWRPLAWTKTE